MNYNNPAGLNGYLPAAQEELKNRPGGSVYRELQLLEKQLYELHEVVDALSANLHPLMRPTATQVSKGPAERDIGGNCELAAGLNSHNASLAAAITRLRSLFEGLDL